MAQPQRSEIIRTFPIVTCPGCDLPMQQLVTESGPDNLHRTTFRCDKCGTEADHIFTMDDLEAP